MHIWQSVNDRPAGVGRNTGHGFDYAALDLRLSHRFRLGERSNLEAIVEGFNILNRPNLQLPNNTFGSGVTPNANFGQPTAADTRAKFSSASDSTSETAHLLCYRGRGPGPETSLRYRSSIAEVTARFCVMTSWRAAFYKTFTRGLFRDCYRRW
jgi:hypothetical protein